MHNGSRTHCAATELVLGMGRSEAGEEGEEGFQQKEQHENIGGMNTTQCAGKRRGSEIITWPREPGIDWPGREQSQTLALYLIP